MTEQEAIKKINMMDEALNFQRHDADECSQALQMAIESLEKQIPTKPIPIDWEQYKDSKKEGYNQALEDFTRQLSVELIELPLDDLIVADILNNVKGIYQQLKK